MKAENDAITLARAILHDRKARRSFVLQLVFVLLTLVALGYWVLGGWLEAAVWRFLLWWGAVGVLTLFIVLFALYDALRVVQEEKEKLMKEIVRQREDSSED